MNASEVEMVVTNARKDMVIACENASDLKRKDLIAIGSIVKKYLDLAGSQFEEQTLLENMFEAGYGAL